MTRRLTAADRWLRYLAPCGGYQVRVRQGRIRVVCQACGPCSTAYTPAQAQLVARELRGPLARFVTPAPRADRLALADLLDQAARGLRTRRRRRAHCST